MRFYKYIASIILLISFGPAFCEPLVWNLNWNDVSACVGRDAELADIRNTLHESKVVALYGISGIGKSKLSLCYGDLHKNEYDIIWKINAQNDLTQEFNELAKAIKIKLGKKSNLLNLKYKDEIVYSVKDFLRTSGYRWLLIFDDFNGDNGEDFIPFSHVTKNSHVIITSQKKHNTNIRNIEIGEMLPNDLQELLTVVSGKELKYKAQDVISLCDISLTIDMVAVGAKIKNNNPVLYLEDGALACGLTGGDLYNGKITSAVNEVKARSPKAFELLSYLSFMESSSISVSIVEGIFLTNQNSRDDFYRAVEFLSSYLIIHKDGGDNIIKIHKKYQEAVRSVLPIKVQREIIEKMCNFYSDVISKEEKTVFSDNAYGLFFKHICKMIGYAKNIPCNEGLIFKLHLGVMDYFLLEIRDLDTVEVIIAELNQKISSSSIPDKLKAIYYSKVSDYFFQKGMILDALNQQNKALNYFRKHRNDSSAVYEEYLKGLIAIVKCAASVGDSKLAMEYDDEIQKHLFSGNGKPALSEINRAYLNTHYYEVKSYLHYLWGDIDDAIACIDKAFIYVDNMVRL